MAKDGSNKNWFGRHKILTAGGVIIVLAIVAGGSGGTNKQTSKSSEQKKESATEQTAKIGEAARDGKFQFTVSKFSCGESVVGTSQYLQKTAQGQYCRLSLGIKNIGDRAQSLLSNDQKLIDVNGKEYSADDTATLYAAPQGSASTWYNEINPGNSVSGDLIFDVPKDVTPNSAVLHDSSFSSGVKIILQ